PSGSRQAVPARAPRHCSSVRARAPAPSLGSEGKPGDVAPPDRDAGDGPSAGAARTPLGGPPTLAPTADDGLLSAGPHARPSEGPPTLAPRQTRSGIHPRHWSGRASTGRPTWGYGSLSGVSQPRGCGPPRVAGGPSNRTDRPSGNLVRGETATQPRVTPEKRRDAPSEPSRDSAPCPPRPRARAR